MDRISWPAIIIIGIVVLTAGYFVGQARLHHTTPGTNAGTVATAQPLR
jgi:hypothetical protein